MLTSPLNPQYRGSQDERHRLENRWMFYGSAWLARGDGVPSSSNTARATVEIGQVEYGNAQNVG